MQIKILAAAVGLALTTPAAAVVTTYTIIYGSGSCTGGCSGGGDPITNGFGSVPDVELRNGQVIVGSLSGVDSLRYWSSGSYSGSSAAYYEYLGYDTQGAVAFLPSHPGTITLVSVDFGGYSSDPVTIDWQLSSQAGIGALGSGSVTTNPSALTTVYFNASAGFNLPMEIRFGAVVPNPAYDYRAGIQNIVFSFDDGVIVPAPGVPEPATWAMMLAGFGGVGFAMRRRRVAVPA